MFRHLNLNPRHKNVGDCAVRAISLLMDEPWDKIYTDLSVLGFEMKDLLDSNYEKKGGPRNVESDL